MIEAWRQVLSEWLQGQRTPETIDLYPLGNDAWLVTLTWRDGSTDQRLVTSDGIIGVDEIRDSDPVEP